MKQIISPHNSQLKHLAKLGTSAKYRRECRQTVLEGTHLLDALLQTGTQPQQVYLAQSCLDKPEIQNLLSRIPPAHTTAVEDRLLAKASALADGGSILSLTGIPETAAPPQSGDCVVLEHIQDPGNIGTILRSAAAAGIYQIIADTGCADLWSPKVLRSAMGAHFLLRLYPAADLKAWRQSYESPLFATTLAENSISLYRINLRQPCAWLFGNEGGGITPAAGNAATHTVKIPMSGATESLNVAMAATVCLFEQMRQRLG
ncbi:23S rRNA (guanosine-2'-O-)-methyltransferase RlmB [Kingella potus]|uniref:23S rRNA (Guanosine-2'-O-)-methyltransferase RlmB n=1 Tax=Kingella potus TaxID=265175 RepID=A0A377R483_9NEIS|nr:RNA methyltransferase [Kingella potus]UOP01881.1 RNA methyltransferase [Kingella potus]STR03143.1 23S rRNA (guanosine-2'-O-)-methyltransferase RlmB [Kingella potus]